MITEFRVVELEEAYAQKLREVMHCSCASSSSTNAGVVSRAGSRSDEFSNLTTRI
jgi:hypothetical protein